MRYLLALALVLVVGCVSPGGSSGAPPTTYQEQIVADRVMGASGNVVSFGNTIASETSQAQVVAFLDAIVKGRLPGVTFFIFHYPIDLAVMGMIGVGPGGQIATLATSTRDPVYRRIILSWWDRKGRPSDSGKPDSPPNLPSGKPDAKNTYSVGDASWEIEHLVTNTDDDGKPYK